MEREANLHYARVMLLECRARRHQRRFAAFLLNCAINATRAAMQTTGQMSLDL